MATIVFDFDSTLIGCESLEKILLEKLTEDPCKLEKMHSLTNQGMSGEISFARSLTERLKIAQPTLDEVNAFGENAHRWMTPGIKKLISDLTLQSVDVWIVSGGLIESILPLAESLGVTPDKTQAVCLKWKEDGSFGGIDPKDKFSFSKLDGVREFAERWSHPRIGIGDGMSDYELFEHGLVDHFIAFTQHVKRQAVIETGASQAHNVFELREQLEALLDHDETVHS
jgi:HAD superfamily phosphoserine phosphatase-like hydrolase